MFYYVKLYLLLSRRCNSFANLTDAREYFFDEGLLKDYDDDYAFRRFLEESYTLIELFKMTDDDKADIVSDYEEGLFDEWVYEELVKCELYKSKSGT